MITRGMGLVAQWLSRLHRMWEDAGSNPAGPIPSLPGHPRGGLEENLRRSYGGGARSPATTPFTVLFAAFRAGSCRSTRGSRSTG